MTFFLASKWCACADRNAQKSVCCSVLQCVAASALQHVGAHAGIVAHCVMVEMRQSHAPKSVCCDSTAKQECGAATHCNTLKRAHAPNSCIKAGALQCVAVCCSVLQYVAVSVLQHAGAHENKCAKVMRKRQLAVRLHQITMEVTFENRAK